MATRVKIQANEIAANSGKTYFDNVASYIEAPLLSDLDGADIVCKDNLTEAIPEQRPDNYIDTVTAGDNMPKLVGIPARFANMDISVSFEIILPQDGAFYPTTTDGATMVFKRQYDSADRTNVSRIDISGAPDANGKFADSFKFVIYAL